MELRVEEDRGEALRKTDQWIAGLGVDEEPAPGRHALPSDPRGLSFVVSLGQHVDGEGAQPVLPFIVAVGDMGESRQGVPGGGLNEDWAKGVSVG